jgi:hypothetical protein
MRGCRRARLVGGLLAAALMFLGDDSWAQDPTPTPTPTATPVCTPAGRATNGCWDVPVDVNQDMSVPSWADVEYQTNEIAELIMLRQDVIALRRFVVIIGGMLLGWLMMSFLFDAITGRR